mmetsp:Transcript_76243/g.217869  ORF Transcript_76243/g.217869 Transcript_76243/m.217869 type:complete len:200 (-) Transcript_76243:2409-3008(-)
MLDGLKLNAVTLSPALIRPQVLFEDVARAVTRIRQGVRKTGLSKSYWLSEICGCEVYLKHELRQFTGSFKERGARNALECLRLVVLESWDAGASDVFRSTTVRLLFEFTTCASSLALFLKITNPDLQRGAKQGRSDRGVRRQPRARTRVAWQADGHPSYGAHAYSGPFGKGLPLSCLRRQRRDPWCQYRRGEVTGGDRP